MHVVVSSTGKLPTRGSSSSAGLDLFPSESIVLTPGVVTKIPTGIRLAIPEGYYGDVRPRSGNSLRGVLVVVGTVDSDYRGELCVMVYSLTETVTLSPDKAIAQLVISPYYSEALEVVSELDVTARGTAGFGSTGTVC